MFEKVGNLFSFAISKVGKANSSPLNGLRRTYFKTGRELSSIKRNMAKHKAITVSVDGNISSGKSTLVANLKELFPANFNLQVELIPEPLEKWTNLQGHNLLQMYYEDPVKYNFMFQNYVQLTRLMETIKKPPDVKNGEEGTVRIMERSLQNNRYCFVELARREGNLQPEEFAVLQEWHSWLEKHFDLALDLIIYLRTSPETVFGRMKTRGREEESSVPLKYLQNLHETYEDWLVRGKVETGSGSTWNKNALNSNINARNNQGNGVSEQKIIVIDANQGKEEVAAECRNLLRGFMIEKGYEVKDDGNLSRKRKHND